MSLEDKVAEITKACMARMRHGAHGIGIRRDRAALEYMIGAAKAAHVAGDTKLSRALSSAVFMVSLSGYAYLEKYMKERNGE